MANHAGSSQNFFNDPTIQRKYYLAIKDLAETTFSAPRMAEIIDEVLDGYVSEGQRSR